MAPVLSDRLSKIASLVPHCDTVADIGADHALLSIFLLETQVCSSVFCTDLNPLPLTKARAALSARGLSSHAEFLLGDGLLPLKEKKADCVVIAGMGGDTIAQILSVEKSLLRDKLFLLQPMSKHSSLRRFCAQAGFCIEEELLAADEKRIYPILRVFYDGTPKESAQMELLCGRHNLLRRDPLTLRYLKGILASLTRCRDGRQKAQLPTGSADTLIAALSEHIETQEKSL